MSAAVHSGSGAILLPVAGGKGGIGKSAVAANLGLVLARLEHRVILMDADLGGSDLHNLLGLKNDLPGLGELLTQKDLALDQVVHPVLESNLQFVPGDAMLVATANPSFQKKRKLLNAIRKLSAEYVLLDLGPGTAITVMDFFLVSPLSLLVMLPERPAVLNAFNFLKNVLFRVLERSFKQNSKSEKVLAQYRARGRGPGAMNTRSLVDALDDALPGSGKKAWQEVSRLRPKLLLNRARRVDDFVYASQLEGWVSEDLGIKVEVLGLLPEDDVLKEAGAKSVPALELNPRAPFCRALTQVGLKLAQWAGRPMEWAAHSSFGDSFTRSATEYAPMFPPPGSKVPTRAELVKRLRYLETQLKD